MDESKADNGISKSGSRLKKHITNLKFVIIGGSLLLAVIIVVILFVYFRSFSDYDIRFEDTSENTFTYSYYVLNGNVLKCASGSAVLADSKNGTIWTVEYDMNNPNVDVCGDYAVIYDVGGTRIVVVNSEGMVSSFSVEKSIVKTGISSVGTVAVIMDDGSNAQIDYFDAEGEMIATVVTTMTDDGYPMDIALSDDGMDLVVSYLVFNSGSTQANVVFYDFGTTGQNADDNIVGGFAHANEIIPDLEYMDGNRIVAYGSEMIYIYEIDDEVLLIDSIEIEEEIQSTFTGGDYFGYVVQSENGTGSEIVVCKSNGSEITRIETEISYTSLEVYDEQIILYNSHEVEIYTKRGIMKFGGQFDGVIRQIRRLKGYRYAYASADGYYVIKLT